MPMFPGLPECLYHGSAEAFALDMLEPQNLGRQLFSGKQNVIDRIVASFEPIDWRSC